MNLEQAKAVLAALDLAASRFSQEASRHAETRDADHARLQDYAEDCRRAGRVAAAELAAFGPPDGRLTDSSGQRWISADSVLQQLRRVEIFGFQAVGFVAASASPDASGLAGALRSEIVHFRKFLEGKQ